MIEWPMYIEKLIPDDAIQVEILNMGGDNRKITIDAPEKVLEAIK